MKAYERLLNYVVVVLPLVPVIPMTFSFSAGYPKYAADVIASA